MRLGNPATLLVVALTCGASVNATAHSGDPDIHFGASGAARIALPDPILPLVQPIDIDQANRIVFGASTTGGDVIGVLDANGNLDTAFASSGFIPLDQYVSDLKVDSKNRFIVLQTDVSGPFIAIEISRFLNDGSIDTSFGVRGAITLSRRDEDIVPAAIGLDGADNIFVVGTQPSDPLTGDSRILVGKVTSRGVEDPSFAGGKLSAITIMPATTEQSFGQAIAINPDGGLTVTGYSRLATRVIVDDVVKLLPDGTPDPSFGAGKGFVQTDALPATSTPHYTFSESVVVDEAGNIITGGFAGDWSDYTSSFVVTRYLPDGTLDVSFNGGAPELLNIASHRTGQAASVMIDARGRIVLTGLSSADITAPNQFAVFRLNPDGSRDRSFGDGDGAMPVAGHVVGGRGVLTHNQDILIIGNTDDAKVLIWNELIGYDLPPVSPPTHF